MYLESDASTQELGAKTARGSSPPLVIYLRGDLGSGKTTFARGFVQALGHPGHVKSPTFSLEETYMLEHVRLCHFDLYRIQDPRELEFIGIRDVMAAQDTVCLIEWPERGGDTVPGPDIEFVFAHQGSGRRVNFHASSARGQSIIELI